MSSDLVYWHQSLFLQPQHLQLTDRRTKYQFGNGVRLWAAYPYGLLKLVISLEALAVNTFQIDTLQMLTPGSSEAIELPGQAVCPARMLPEELTSDDKMMVYLGFRNIKKGEPAVTLAENDDQARSILTRYLAPENPELVPDLYSQGPEAEVRFLKNVIKIIYEPELADYGDYTLMPVARVMREEGGNFICDAGYFPPCLNLAAWPSLAEMVRTIRDRLAIKTRSLEISKVVSGGGLEALTMLVILQSLALSTIKLDNLLKSPAIASPWDAHGVLREIMASLSVFSVEVDYNGVSLDGPEEGVMAYSHNDSAPQFLMLRERIYKILDSLSAGPRYLVRFLWQEPYFIAELPRHMLDEGREFWLLVKAGEGDDPERIAEKVSRYLRLASRSGLPVLLAQAVEGIPFTQVKTPPQQLPKGPGILYFKIHYEKSPLWDEVIDSSLLCAFCDALPPNSQLQLAILSGGGV